MRYPSALLRRGNLVGQCFNLIMINKKKKINKKKNDGSKIYIYIVKLRHRQEITDLLIVNF
jgi:hypothetical protein